MHPLLQVEKLDISFTQDEEKTRAVKEISFRLEQGEMMALVGESGSGKSVTALSFLQLLPQQAGISGNIFFSSDGKEQVNLAKAGIPEMEKIRGNKIAMIFQEPMTSLNPVFTCGNQVMESLRLHQHLSKAAARQRTIELFTQVELPDPTAMLTRYPHELSGGQKQRVMIAMAISCNPALLIADEPTTALDVSVQKHILQLVKKLQLKYNMGVLLITHDLGLVAEVADSIAVMYKGELVETGPATQILSNPQNPYTQALLACRPAANSKGHRLPQVADFLSGDEPPRNDLRLPHTAKITTEPFLKVQHLSVVYPGRKKIFSKDAPAFKAVDDVSFVIHKNETLGLVGESGCGKTTLGRALLQLIKPTSGTIELGGKNLATLSLEQLRKNRKDFQIVFQDPYGSLNPSITIGEAILEPLKVHNLLDNNRQRKEKTMDLLRQVSLQEDHYNRYPHQFSGGQRQRICIARALALAPSFIVFDESVSALDVSVQASVLNLINDLKDLHQFTTLFISHDLAVVHYISDRIMVMRQGKIIESGTADKVFNNPKESYTQMLLEAIPGRSIGH